MLSTGTYRIESWLLNKNIPIFYFKHMNQFFLKRSFNCQLLITAEQGPKSSSLPSTPWDRLLTTSLLVSLAAMKPNMRTQSMGWLWQMAWSLLYAMVQAGRMTLTSGVAGDSTLVPYVINSGSRNQLATSRAVDPHSFVAKPDPAKKLCKH